MYTPWLDPRRALRGDSARWELLLEAAYQAHGALFAALYELRRRGGRIEHEGPTDWTLRPEGPLPDWRLVRGAELTADEYTELRQHGLAPHGELLSRLLRAPPCVPVVEPEPNSSAPELVSLGGQNGPARDLASCPPMVTTPAALPALLQDQVPELAPVGAEGNACRALPQTRHRGRRSSPAPVVAGQMAMWES